MHSSDDPFVDPQALARLRRWGGEPLLRRMAELFLREAPPRIAAVRQGVRAAAHEEARQAAHSLKSSCAQMGALRMRDLCEQVETFAAQSSTRDAAPLLPALEAEFARYAAWLEQTTANTETGQ